MRNNAQQDDRPPDSIRIAFGSCNNQNLTNNLWDVIAKRDPLAFVWVGDSIYADIHLGNDWTKFPPMPIMSPATPERLRKLYDIQRKNPAYAKFLKQTNATIFGTIDDHDMGMNNADETYEFKRESAVEFLNFVGEDRQSAMFQRAWKGYGVYGVKVFDFGNSKGRDTFLLSDEEAGMDPDVVGYVESTKRDMPSSSAKQYKEKRVAIFLLDARTNRTPWGHGLDAWKRNYSGDFLGERQWKWFEHAIAKSDAALNIIVNGLQVHPFRHPNCNAAEQWSQFPTSRQRLYDAIMRDDVRAPILVTGDVHMAQIMRKDCWLRKKDHGGSFSPARSRPRPLVEFTTSGMTHSWGTVFASSEKFHKTWRYLPMHILSKSVMTVAHWILPMPDVMVSQLSSTLSSDNFEKESETAGSGLYENGGAEGAKHGKQYSLEKNFGEIEIFWENNTIAVRALGEDESAPPLLSASFSLDELSGTQIMPGSIDNIQSYQYSGRFMLDGSIVDDSQTICVNHRGPASIIHFIFGFVAMTILVSIFLLGPQLLLCRFLFHRMRKAMRYC